jgi:hypothetical protein
VNDLRLQLLQSRFRLLRFRQVADETGKETLIARLHLAYGQLHRKSRTALAFAHRHPAYADDSPFSSGEIALEVGIVIFPIGGRHQHFHVLAQHLGRRIAEQPLRRRAE